MTSPADTTVPTPANTGRLSPVSRLRSTSDAPSATTPSTGIRPPGRTRTRSPATTSEIGRTTSSPSTSTVARGTSSAANSSAAERATARVRWSR
ncbi:MAG: hypothetical protein ACD_54C00424G0005 [uncultured bacterium]|nr:MAG: hypothetical protein ACD_54C00424G0005 [uncultured bacterium]